MRQWRELLFGPPLSLCRKRAMDAQTGTAWLAAAGTVLEGSGIEREVRAQTNGECESTSVTIPSRTLITPRFWQVLDNRLATRRLRIQAHQIEELRSNVRPNGQTEALCRLICNRVVVSPGAVR